MIRKLRNDNGNKIYHVLNRANGRFKIFEDDSDYELFEGVLIKGISSFDIKLFSYNIMPNHFHMVLYSDRPGEVSRFMQWLSTTFTIRWHIKHGTTGTGHLFQGRYKSFSIENDAHLLQVLLYVERNALRAGLVKRAEGWRWCSAWVKIHGNKKQRGILSAWPIDLPEDYLGTLNNIDNELILNKIRLSITKDVPIDSIEKIKPRGRPRIK